MEPTWTKEEVTSWREAAVADGWIIRPTYRHEPVESAATLDKDGFKAMLLARPATKTRRNWNDVHVWGPDGLAIDPPKEYSMDALIAGLRQCHYCSADDVDTTRYLFAGRCCLKCRKSLREPAGWTR